MQEKKRKEEKKKREREKEKEGGGGKKISEMLPLLRRFSHFHPPVS